MKRGRPRGILLALSACLMAASCTSRDIPANRTPTVVVFKHGKLAADASRLRALLQEFERRHPGVIVREEVLPSSTDQQHQFYAVNLDSREAAFDLLAVDVIWVQEFARAGWIQALDHLAESAERGAYFPAAIRAATFEGHLYAIPWYMDAGLLYYRRDLLQRYGFTAPRTWPELVKITRIILAGERNPALSGFIWQGKQYEGLMCATLEFIWGRGGDLLEDRGAEAEAAVTFMRDLIEEGIAPKLVSTADEESTRHIFGAGRVIFMRNWPYAWTLLQQEDSPVRGKVGVAPLPSFPGHEPTSVLGGWMLAIPRGAAHPREARALIGFLTSLDIQRRMALDLGHKPARRELYADPMLLDAQPWIGELYRVFLAARPRPVTPYYLMLSQVWQPELSSVLVGTKSPAMALASARRQSAAILGSAGQQLPVRF
jgi:multiple sugar transport system substrate-binding protein